MMRWHLVAAISLLASCTPLPLSYPVPEQRNQKEGPEPEPLGAFVSFADPHAPDYIVSGFLGAAPEQVWRWATTSPTVRVRLSDPKNLRFRITFALPEDSHKPLLPITVRYFINDRLLAPVIYRTAGHLEFHKPVPADWLRTDADNIIRCEIDPAYVAEADGIKLGMIISEMGLERFE